MRIKRILWPKRDFSAADGHPVLLTENGEMIFAKASPESFEPISKQPILSGRWRTIPTLYDACLHARNFERAACVNLTN